MRVMLSAVKAPLPCVELLGSADCNNNTCGVDVAFCEVESRRWLAWRSATVPDKKAVVTQVVTSNTTNKLAMRSEAILFINVYSNDTSA